MKRPLAQIVAARHVARFSTFIPCSPSRRSTRERDKRDGMSKFLPTPSASPFQFLPTFYLLPSTFYLLPSTFSLSLFPCNITVDASLIPRALSVPLRLHPSRRPGQT